MSATKFSVPEANLVAIYKGKTRGILTDERISKLDELGMVWKYKPKRRNKPEIISKKDY